MTEQEWLTWGHEPGFLLEHLGDALTPRESKPFAAACLRRIWHLLPDEDCRLLVTALEDVADGSAGEGELRRLTDRLYEASQAAGPPGSADPGLDAAVCAGLGMPDHAACNAAYAACGIDQGEPNWGELEAAECAAQCNLLRDVVGNPFRPITFDPAERTAKVRAAAHLTYARRALPEGHLNRQSLAALADALEAAGCHDAGILGHCRGDGPHVRGCWVVDLVLGRS